MLQGHCHPKVIKALVEQAEQLTLSSRAFYNDRFPTFAESLTSMFGYEMVLPMNTGAEGVETAVKLTRKWGYKKKKIPKDEVLNTCSSFFLCLKQIRDIQAFWFVLLQKFMFYSFIYFGQAT